MSAADAELDGWDEWATLWGRYMRGHYDGKGTPALYLSALKNLTEWARANGKGDPAALTTSDLEAYFAHFRDRKNKRTGEPISGAYMKRDYVALRAFFKYLVKREGIENPMAGVDAPRTKPKRVEVFTDDELRALLATCKGRGFTERRDTAILRVFIDVGARREEVAAIEVGDVDLDSIVPTLALTGKGGKQRRVHLGSNAAEALGLYLRVRRQHKDARLKALWLTDPTQHRGALGYSGLGTMLKRRGADAGVEGVHPHRFRHTAYDALVQAGGDGTEAMTHFGWSSRSMLDHYAATSAEKRTVAIMHRLSPGDRL